MLEEVERTGECLTILKRGRAIAVVTPPVTSYPQFSLRGTVTIHGDIVEPAVPEEDWECLQ